MQAPTHAAISPPPRATPGLPELPLPAAAASSSITAPAHVEQLFFFATHEVSAVDARLLRHYQLQLRDAARTALWVLLYRPELDQIETGESEALALPVCAWGDGALRRELPRLSEQIGRIAGLGEVSARRTRGATRRRRPGPTRAATSGSIRRCCCGMRASDTPTPRCGSGGGSSRTWCSRARSGCWRGGRAARGPTC